MAFRQGSERLSCRIVPRSLPADESSAANGRQRTFCRAGSQQSCSSNDSVSEYPMKFRPALPRRSARSVDAPGDNRSDGDQANPQGCTHGVGDCITPAKPAIRCEVLQAFACKPCQGQRKPQRPRRNFRPTQRRQHCKDCESQRVQQLVMTMAPSGQASHGAQQTPQNHHNANSEQCQCDAGYELSHGTGCRETPWGCASASHRAL